MTRTICAVALSMTIAAALGPPLIGDQSPTVSGYPESRQVDDKNAFANVGALITTAEKNDAGVPEGFLAKCSGTLLHERVFLTAGHCICPAQPAPPPFARLHVTFDRNARDESKWRRVVGVAGHPSLLPCLPPKFSEAWPLPPLRGLSDVGLAFLAEPVTDLTPARLARVGTLTTAGAAPARMSIVGYGLLQTVPRERQFADWDGLRRLRSKRLTQVIDETWATWELPSDVCDGDSGGPIFHDGGIVATVSVVGRECRDASIHARIDVASVQSWIAQTIKANVRSR